jgi:hypothetical protein
LERKAVVPVVEHSHRGAGDERGPGAWNQRRHLAVHGAPGRRNILGTSGRGPKTGRFAGKSLKNVRSEERRPARDGRRSTGHLDAR